MEELTRGATLLNSCELSLAYLHCLTRLSQSVHNCVCAVVSRSYYSWLFGPNTMRGGLRTDIAIAS